MSTGIKNPFGDPSSDFPSNSKDDLSTPITNNNTSNTENAKFNSEEDYIKNELAKSGISEESIKFGLNMGKQFVKNSKFIGFFSLDGLKPYFDVDNKYVLIKLRQIFLPFLKNKNISNNIQENVTDKYSLEHIDLYLPIMSFITYVLAVGFNIAFKNPELFKQQTLGKISTKDFSLYIINAVVLKLLMFVFLNHNLSFLDVFALVGYKFILLIIYVLLNCIFSSKTVKYCILGVLSLLCVLFVKRCLDKKLTEENFKKTVILLALGLEVLTMFLILLDLS